MPTKIRIEPRPPRDRDAEEQGDASPATTGPRIFDGVCQFFAGAGACLLLMYLVQAVYYAGYAASVSTLLAFYVSSGLLIYALLGRPVARLIQRAREESGRLREAMTCPYCRDQLDAEALLCGRPACGAIYHPECWEECRHEYGGCAIYGCGHTHATEVGRFALQRRLARLVLAAILFPPRAVARLRELEGKSFGQVWDEAQAHQQAISENPQRTMAYAALNLAVSLAVCAPVILMLQGLKAAHAPLLQVVAPILAVLVVPVLMIRFPLARAFGWGSAKLVARAFRGELGALGRADAGTVLGRLLAGVGKKKG